MRRVFRYPQIDTDPSAFAVDMLRDIKKNATCPTGAADWGQHKPASRSRPSTHAACAREPGLERRSREVQSLRAEAQRQSSSAPTSSAAADGGGARLNIELLKVRTAPRHTARHRTGPHRMESRSASAHPRMRARAQSHARRWGWIDRFSSFRTGDGSRS